MARGQPAPLGASGSKKRAICAIWGELRAQEVAVPSREGCMLAPPHLGHASYPRCGVPRALNVTLVLQREGGRSLRVGLAVPLLGTAAELREMVAREGDVPPQQVTGWHPQPLWRVLCCARCCALCRVGPCAVLGHVMCCVPHCALCCVPCHALHRVLYAVPSAVLCLPLHHAVPRAVFCAIYSTVCCTMRAVCCCVLSCAVPRCVMHHVLCAIYLHCAPRAMLCATSSALYCVLPTGDPGRGVPAGLPALAG